MEKHQGAQRVRQSNESGKEFQCRMETPTNNWFSIQSLCIQEYGQIAVRTRVPISSLCGSTDTEFLLSIIKMKQHRQHHQPVGVLKKACDALCSSDTGLPLDTWSIFCLGLSWFCPSATGSGSEQLNLTGKCFCAHAGNVQLS